MGHLDLLLPAFAPLPPSVLLHILLNRRRASLSISHHSPSTITPPLATPLERETGFTLQEWDLLERDIRAIRQEVFALMDPVVRQDELTNAWLEQALFAATPRRHGAPRRRSDRVARSTLREWQNRGFITIARRNHPDPHQSAALLIARKADTERVSKWLPGAAVPDADRQTAPIDLAPRRPPSPPLVCWQQEPPPVKGGPPPEPTPCPLPPPAGLEKANLLASAWPGVVWNVGESWRRVNSLGAVRWAGVTGAGWDITQEDLGRWMKESEAFVVPHIEMAPDMLQKLADLVLIRVGWDLLSVRRPSRW